jgi:hypothetical protein
MPPAVQSYAVTLEQRRGGKAAGLASRCERSTTASGSQSLTKLVSGRYIPPSVVHDRQVLIVRESLAGAAWTLAENQPLNSQVVQSYIVFARLLLTNDRLSTRDRVKSSPTACARRAQLT